MPLDQATLERLAGVKEKQVKQSHLLPEVGPARHIHFIKTQICTHGRCLCPAEYAVQGAPKCSVHAIYELNEMLIGQGFKGVSFVAQPRSTPMPDNRMITTTARAYLQAGYALSRFECVHGIKLSEECDECG